MSQENLEMVRRANENLDGVNVAPSIRAALKGDLRAIPPKVGAGFAAWIEMFDPDVEIDTSRVDMPGFGVFRGPDAIRELWGSWIEGWDSYSWTHSNWCEVREHVIADARIRATGKSSGVDVTWDHCQVWTFRDHKVVRWLMANDRAEALEALGLKD